MKQFVIRIQSYCPNNRQHFHLDKPITDIDSDIDACQVALSPSVNLNRLKCSPDIPSVRISEKRSGSRKR